MAHTMYNGADIRLTCLVPVGTLAAHAAQKADVTAAIVTANAYTDTSLVTAKAYSDSLVQGLDSKVACRVLAAANIVLSGTQTIDGVAAVAGDRVLCIGQTSSVNNGIYVVAVGAWARSADAQNNAEVRANMFVFISEGTTYADTGWTLSSNNAINVGVSALVFTQFSAAGVTTAGAGLTKTGSSFSVNVTANRTAITANAVDVAPALLPSPVTADGTNKRVLRATAADTAVWTTPDVVTISQQGELAATDYTKLTAILPTLASGSIPDNQAATVLNAAFNYNPANFSGCAIQICMRRGTNLNVFIGTILIANSLDGSLLVVDTFGTEIGTVGVTFTVVFAAGVITLKAASTSTGAVIPYTAQQVLYAP